MGEPLSYRSGGKDVPPLALIAVFASMICLLLAACAPQTPLPPTPTKTPEPIPTREAIFPSVEALAEAALQPEDVGSNFEDDAPFHGPLTRDGLLESVSLETGAFISDLPNVYGYRTAYFRADSVEGLIAVRSWLVVFESVAEARRFAALHPTLIANEQDFQIVPLPVFGEESAAYRATSNEAGVVPLDRHDLVFRRRNVVVVLFMVTPAGLADLNAFQGYGSAIDMRLLELGDGG